MCLNKLLAYIYFTLKYISLNVLVMDCVKKDDARLSEIKTDFYENKPRHFCQLIMQMNECNLKLQINYDQQQLVLLVVDVSECVQEVSVRNDDTFSL